MLEILTMFPTVHSTNGVFVICSNKMDIGLMLRDCLAAAKKEDRVTCGLDNACELLET